MRDIRGDLQERAKLLEAQIGATQSQFDKYIEQLKLEHQGKLEDLKSDLDTVRMVMKTEDRLGSRISPSKQSEPRPSQRPQQAQSQQATSDSLMRKVSALR
jgi:acyl carrier protein